MARDEVLVPDVVGMEFTDARALASRCGVTLANPDADGPPIGALAWPERHVIIRQEPPTGTVVAEWDSVSVWIAQDPGAPAAEAAVR